MTPTLEAPPAPPFAGLLRHLGSISGAIRRALLSPAALAGAAGALAAGFLLTWIFSSALRAPPGANGPAPAAMAASFVLNLAVLGVWIALLPLDARNPWPGFSAWLRGVLWAAAAFAGLKFAPGSGVEAKTAAALAALTIAQGAALCGAGGLLTRVLAPRMQAARMALALALALAATGLFWSRPVLLNLYKESPRAGTAATQAVLAFCPSTSLAGIWNESGGGFDLVKGPNTYRIWLGSYYPLTYPRLWPGRAEEFGGAENAPWAPGLALTLGVWGILLLLLGDLLRTESLSRIAASAFAVQSKI